MGIFYRNSSGIETPVAGLAPAGQLVPSVALKQSGTVTFSCEANSWTTVDVTFATPMPDADYLVVTDSGETAYVHVQNATRKSTTGFTMIIWNRDAVSNTGIIRWTAFKLMTDEVHEADRAHIAQNTANFAPAFSEVTSYAVGDYVTYNGILYRCTTAHTAGVWVAGHFTQVTVGDSIARYNDELSLPGYYSNDVLIAIKATADAAGNYKMFQGDTQAGAEAAWFGLKKTSDYWHCTVWDGHGLVAHLVYKNGTYTANVIHEGVSN